MADPTTIAAGVGIGSSIAGMFTGAAGASQSAAASAQSYRYKAQVAQFNKQINEQNARWALDAGDTRAMEAGLKSRQEIASTKVAQSASGFDINAGSAEAVRDTQAEVAAFDQNVIRFDARKTAFGYQAKAKGDEMEANLDLISATNAEKAGRLGVLSSFLSGAGNVSSKWLQGRSIGIGSGSGSGSTLGQELDYSMS